MRNTTLLLLFSVLLVAVTVASALRGDFRQGPKSERGVQGDTAPSPKDVVQVYWDAALAGEIERSKTYTTNTLGSVTIVDEDMRVGWAKVVNQKRLVIRKVEKEVTDGDEARVVVEAVGDDKEVRKIQHDLVREKGTWKILAIYYSTDLPDDIIPR